ncbi:MAG: hypothetical protein GY936_10675 [Ignavibacteriae bacterium]|nr:hypothetical protein [Ignavibacteriota bacterium]
MNYLAELHPLVIHFPIAFLFLFVGLEIINLFIKKDYLKNISHLLLLISVIALIAAVFSGNQSMQIVIDGISNKDILAPMEAHEQFATITLWYYFTLLIFRTYLFVNKKFESKLQYLFVIFAVLGLYLVFTTAKFGGILVYDFGIGTKLFN